MYFDSRPKNKKEDFFDREKELATFEEVLSYTSSHLFLGPCVREKPDINLAANEKTKKEEKERSIWIWSGVRP